jgi:pre-mRNA-processing factor 6
LVTKDEILSDVDKALAKYPDCYKLYLEKIQLLMENNCPKQAREVAAIGTKACPAPEDLWIMLAEIDETNLNVTIRARSILDTAIMQIPKSEKLWEAKIMLERRNNDLVSARQIANKAMKLFPESPLVRMQYLSLIPKMSQRKNALVDALNATNNSSAILLGIGVLFWVDGKTSKAKSWFERSLNGDKLNGNCWAWLYCYHKSHSTEEEIKSFLADFEQKYENINKGDIWNRVNKCVQNFMKKPLEILQLVSDEVLKSNV